MEQLGNLATWLIKILNLEEEGDFFENHRNYSHKYVHIFDISLMIKNECSLEKYVYPIISS